MAWITPVTDRPNAQTRTTATDINRISNNLNILKGYVGDFDFIRQDFTDTDIVTKSEWDKIIYFAKRHNQYGLNITYKTDYINLNTIELLTRYAYIVYSRRRPTLSFTLSKKLGSL